MPKQTIHFTLLKKGNVIDSYLQLHPNVPADPVGMGAGPSGVAGEALAGKLDLFRPPPSMKLVDEWSPTPDSEATKSDKKLELSSIEVVIMCNR